MERLRSIDVSTDCNHRCCSISQANGEEPSAAPEPEVDVEAAVAEAVAAVPKPEPSEVTDGDVLSALMDKGEVVKDDIVQALALDALTRASQQ